MISSPHFFLLFNRLMRRSIVPHHPRIWAVRSYYSRSSPRTNLHSRISPLGNPKQSVVPELDGWAESGKRVHVPELRRIILDLRKRRRFTHALQVSEWMGGKGGFVLMPSDHAVRLDLIGKIHGVAAAESYFQSLSEENKTEKTYGSLLNCYVREHLIEKSLSHMQKMKDLGFASVALPYNDLMCLYTNTDQHEKVPDVLAEMKENDVPPDNFSYTICMNSYGARSDIDGMEMVLEEMECQPHITVEWNTYALVANIYIKAGLTDKAVTALKKSEEKLVGNRDGEGYNHLISHYSSLGNKEEVLRLLKLQKASCKRLVNKDYKSILGSLMKMEEFEEAEALLKEWEVAGNCYDLHVPNVVLNGYCQKGAVKKAEMMIEELVKMGKCPISSSYGIVAAGYADRGKMGKAVEFMKRAFAAAPGNEGWKPKPKVVTKILDWFGEEGDVEGVEAFVGLLSTAIGMNREMYHALIRASIKAGRDVDGILSRMKIDNIDVNGETKKILSSRQVTEGLNG
ncbi:pentatricopeptide repeat-containing protein At4g21705, mitochondrial-like [Magnolia sinica]|uniref:pentatricopeptide repeat-containing protein At4g21705, mitochondrial-like n=1 Tax=Magnolia sinica TaxID=86752 RepID=UPI0026591941|nr:pentatricopeptide repeat-containing protein At4g21705, mitochondrial-like [Magnolia sinica]